MTRKNIVKLTVCSVLIAILIIGISVGSAVAFRFEQEISTFLSPPIVDREAMEQSSATGQDLSKRIMEEGAVLLKNNGALPLDRGIRQVNVFGWRSVDWIYGSEGQNASGGVSPEDGDIEKNIDLCKALNAYGVQYNRRLYDMYCGYFKPDRQSSDIKGAHIDSLKPLKEPKIGDKKYYSDELLSYTEEYSDTALVVIGRMIGEGTNASHTEQVKKGPGSLPDNTRHFLEISTEEEELLRYCGEKFENVIVLLNVANAFECGFLDTIPGIDACLYIGFTGTRGAAAIPSLLYGDVSPSGKTVDIFPYDAFTNPANVFIENWYADTRIAYTDLVENIYVGYKWYETADATGVWDELTLYDGDARRIGYDAVVQFPFGHGLSYTQFDWTVKGFYVHDDELEEGEEPTELAPGSAITDKTKIDVVINIKNVGGVRGRDVAEVYLTAPYYANEIEKASVSLVGFGKTDILEPGADGDITIILDAYDFASYDCYGLNNKNGDTHTGWELDAGTYTLSLRTDSHTVKDVYYKDGTEKQAGSFDYSVAELINIDADPVTGKPVDNLFTGEKTVDAVPIDAKSKDGSFDPEIPWFSRSSFPKPSEWSEINVRRNITPDIGTPWTYTSARASAWDNATVNEFGEAITAEKPTWGAGNGLKLAENGIITDLGKKLGADYDAEEWEAVLDQVTVGEFQTMINGYYGTQAMSSVGKPMLTDLDGPAQIKGFSYAPRGTGYPTMVVVAATWNPELAYEFGKSFGDDMKSVGVSGVWGWAIDMHRNAFFGRNHESPSEDSYLAGRIITNAVKGLNTRGRYCFLKHFALFGRDRLDAAGNIFTTEQGLREIYLRPFRMAFVEGGALGCMTTYKGVGAEHSETTIGLLTGVLRREWDFKGAISTDYIGNNAFCDAILRSGGNLGMGVSLSFGGYNENATPRLQQRMRESVKQVLYMWLRADHNERMYAANPDQNDSIIATTSINTWSWWQPMLITLMAVIPVLCAMWLALVLISIFVKSQKKDRLLAAAGAEQPVGISEDVGASAMLGSEADVTDDPLIVGAIEASDNTEQPIEASDDADDGTSSEQAAASAEPIAAPTKKEKTPIKRTPEERAQLLEERAGMHVQRAEKERERAEQTAKKAEELKAQAAAVREKAAAQAKKTSAKRTDKSETEGKENE